jgi:hypothetical protein
MYFTRTASFGSWSSLATAARKKNTPCVEDQSVALPARTSATATDGPIDPCV